MIFVSSTQPSAYSTGSGRSSLVAKAISSLTLPSPVLLLVESVPSTTQLPLGCNGRVRFSQEQSKRTGTWIQKNWINDQMGNSWIWKVFSPTHSLVAVLLLVFSIELVLSISKSNGSCSLWAWSERSKLFSSDRSFPLPVEPLLRIAQLDIAISNKNNERK